MASQLIYKEKEERDKGTASSIHVLWVPEEGVRHPEGRVVVGDQGGRDPGTGP